MVSVRSSVADRRICSIPSSRPFVQTFVAMKARSRAHGGQKVTDDALGAAVHGRGIDEAPAGPEQALQYFGACAALGRVVADIEALPGADAEDGNRLAGRRNASRKHRSRQSAVAQRGGS